MQAATTDIRATTVDELRQHAGALLIEHWKEVEQPIELRVPEPHWRRYAAMEKLGILDVRGLWVDGSLRGYSVTIVDRHLHYDYIMATNTAFVVKKEFRRDGNGKSLAFATLSAVKKMGAKRAFWHAKPGTAMAYMLESIGAAAADIVYVSEVL